MTKEKTMKTATNSKNELEAMRKDAQPAVQAGR
jgi:hypothetical protein